MRQIDRLFWMIVDQGVFATSNFIMNILFARWLTAAEYGMFAVSFSAYLLLTVIHWGAFLEPLLVLSAQIDGNKRRSYIMTLGKAHLVMIAGGTIISLSGFGVAWLSRSDNTAWAIIGAGIAGSLMLTLITARRLCLVFLSPKVSAVVGLVYLIGVLTTGSILAEYDLSWFSLWEIMGFWSLVCSLVIFGLLCARTSGSAPFPMRKLMTFQSQYAPGAIAAAVCQWANFDGILILLTTMLGLDAVAECKAVFTIANPLIHVNAAMHASWLVLFSEQRGKQTNIIGITWLYVIVISICAIALSVTAVPLVKLFYGGKYLGAAWQLPVFVVTIGMSGLSAMITSLFKARGGLWQGFAPGICGAVVAVCVAIVAIPHFGQPGGVYAMAAGAAGSLGLTGLICRFAFPQERGENRPSLA